MPSYSVSSPHRVEISNRTLVRLASPQRRASCGGNSTVHNGLMFADGTMYRGGKGHPDAPSCTKGEHQILAPKPPTPGYSEPTAILPSGLAITLGNGKRLATNGLPSRNSPTPSVVSATHSTGKRRLVSGGVSGSPIRCESPAQSVTHSHKGHTAQTPRDHFIPGVSVERCCGQEKNEPARGMSPHRGIRVMDGCPTFEPPPFQKRPYSPFTKRVVTKPNDNDIFNLALNNNSAVAEPLSASPGVRRGASPGRAVAPYSLDPPPTTVVRRGAASQSVTAGRSPAPINPSIAAGATTPRRSMTPSRSHPPGSSSFNILTGQPL